MRWFALLLALCAAGCSFAEAAPPHANRALLFNGGAAAAWLPSDESGLILWLKNNTGLWQTSACAGGTAVGSDGDPQGCWKDQSTAGDDALEATSAKRPTHKTNITPSGLPVTRYDGGDDCMVVASTTMEDFTIFVAFWASADGVVYEMSINAAANDGLFLYTSQSPSLLHNGTAGTSSYSNGASWGSDSAWRIAVHRSDGTHANHELWVNSAELSMTASGTGDPGVTLVTEEMNIGCRNEANLTITGDIAELFMYDHAVTDEVRANGETYLNDLLAVY